MSSPRGQKKKPKQATSSGKAPQQTSAAARAGGSASSLKAAAGAAPGGGGASPSRVEQSQKGTGTRKTTTGSGGSSRSTSLENTSSQMSAHDLTTAPPRKRTSTSGSKDEGGGGGESQASASKKPTTKAERRALQEAQRKAKAERQIAQSKAGQVAREEKLAKEKLAKESKGGGHKGAGGGGEDKPMLSQVTSHHSRSSHMKTDPALKQVQHFSHLPQFERKARVATLLKDHHPPPCIVQLGLQYSEQLVCGSNARCVAMLAAFKKVIQDYTTPSEKELRRDLDAVIKPHINFLSLCRPLSVSMGNAIKYLKLRISQVPPDMSDSDAKRLLCEVIDDYIREKIELAGEAISEFCGKVINNGDVILVHGHSSVVQSCLMDAHKSGKRFRVIVVDSRPKMEGQDLLRQLLREGIKCSYVLINAVSYIMKEVSKVIFGAHALLANGYVMSRIGTSLIAMVAKSYNVPVLVCCETYKFCDKVLTDAFVSNELGDPNDLVPINRRQGNFLANWQSIKNLQLLNLVYDVTSPDLISMVITQLGNIPCTSVPVVLRISRTFEQM